ncbi:BQ5605_C003g02391 [Microbotryum silenes-dioicae]|uniref:BQ5605_C003g02391 protein n=1 Tax=Microbotryum silenes-dioicae TaxID=796604 RepID=A0A2X0P4I6_9BASI|nr:BQ5605_C003g02391 [Microbotryum silenes-dioicae]
MQAPQQGGAPAQQGTGGDALDKGVDAVLKKAGKGQSASTKTTDVVRRTNSIGFKTDRNHQLVNGTEKISDGVRTGFKKLTGKDVPVQDKPMA